MQPVAFFDIDGTVFRSSLLIRLVEELIAARIFPDTAADGYAPAYEAWQNREGSYETYMDALVTVFRQQLRGVHYGTVADISRLMVAEQSARTYRYTRDLIAALKRDGYYLVAISQSPKMVLDEFCTAYGFDKVYGRIYEIGPTDRFTGVVEAESVITDKANIVTRVFERAAVTPAGSIAVGDTEGDIPMLAAVERPICFNPNQTLFAHAKRQGWEVVVERKDVIYEFNTFD